MRKCSDYRFDGNLGRACDLLRTWYMLSILADNLIISSSIIFSQKLPHMLFQFEPITVILPSATLGRSSLSSDIVLAVLQQTASKSREICPQSLVYYIKPYSQRGGNLFMTIKCILLHLKVRFIRWRQQASNLNHCIMQRRHLLFLHSPLHGHMTILFPTKGFHRTEILPSHNCFLHILLFT